MACTKCCVVAAFMMAAAVVQANQCSTGADEPQNVMSLLQNKLQKPTSPMAGLEVDANSDATALLDMLKDPNAMLSTLENMVSSGRTPAFPLIATIKSLIMDQVMPNLESTQVAAALDTTALLNAFQTCNNQSNTREHNIEISEQASVQNARSLNAGCRDAEKTMFDHNATDPDAYCVKLGVFWHETTTLSIHQGSSRAQFVDYVVAANRTNMCSSLRVLELSDGCTAKESELEDKTAECFTNQASFELAFCTWKLALESNCKALDGCYANAMTAYNSHVNRTKTLVEKWTLETQSLHKILCYCDVWLSDKDHADNNRSQHNATQFDVCKDTTHMPDEVNYGAPEAKVSCLLTSVANHPGTSGFLTQEYSSFSDFVETTIPCPEDGKATSTTEEMIIPHQTTGAPSTTKVVNMLQAMEKKADPFLIEYGNAATSDLTSQRFD